MAIFSLAAGALLTAIGVVGASTFVTGVVATGLAVVAGIGLNYVAKALSGTPEETADKDAPLQGSEGTLTAGGAVSRAFGVGYHATAGSLVYANYWGNAGKTPNAYLTQVIAVGDLPREALLEVWVSGERCTLVPGRADANKGTPLEEYYKPDVEGGPSVDHLWIKYYNGTQTAADPYLTGQVASADRPYPATRVGVGVCYVIATSLVADELFVGFPTFRFGMSGVPLYDPSKDSTNGGSGSHLWSNPATWGGDGDQLPAVQAYNILRGVRFNGAWMFGLQNMTGPARLPAANWIAQIAKCRATVIGEAGAEPTYRSGGMINVDASPANAVEALLTACQGRLSEIGGFYKIHLGTPDSATFAWADADLLSTEEQVYRPFFGLADTVNGIQGTYPDPAQAWETATAPALYRTDLEILDGNRRLMANPQFAFVPYRGQVQRLQKSGLEEAQRARTHVLSFPPAYWVVEPGDVGSWNSFRNGYVDKLFRVDSVVDRANLDCVFNVTEVDPSDYDWDQVVDFTGVATGPTVFARPAPQGVVDWTAEGTVLYDSDGLGRHAAIRITWDNTLSGIIGVQYEVRLKIDFSEVGRGRTDQYHAGALIISQGILPRTEYQIRMQYIPTAPRQMLWSDWIDVLTPDIAIADIPAWITHQVTVVTDFLNDRIEELNQRISTVVSTSGQRNWLDQKEVRSQLSSRSDAAFAEISRVETVATDGDTALASDIETLTAEVGDNSAQITINATAIASIEGWGAAQYAVTLDVNGYASGFELLNGGAGISTATFVQDKFQIAAPGVGGGAPVPIFTVANVGGAPKVALRGDMYVDGTIAGIALIADTITAREIAASTITATEIAADSITADRLVTGTITSDSGKIGALSVKSLSIGDQAVVVPVAQTLNNILTGTTANASSFTMTFDTTGLAGKPITVIAGWVGQQSFTGSGGNPQSTLKILGGTIQSVITSNSADWMCALTGSSTFAANGGTENVTVAIDWVSSGAGGAALGGRTLWAMVGKR